ncbi:Sodium-dependent glucose transporter [Dirofilaria immitis]
MFSREIPITSLFVPYYTIRSIMSLSPLTLILITTRDGMIFYGMGTAFSITKDLLIASCCLIAMLHVNEEAEILSRLGALTSDLEIQHKSLKKKRISFGFIFRNLKAVESCASTDDEENDSNVVYHRLLRNVQKHKAVIKRRGNTITCRSMLLSLSFFALGISTSIQGITMPNMVLNIHTNNSLFVISVFCITAIGFLAGCFTGSSKNVLIIYVYSFISGYFHGTVFRGGLIVLCDSGFGTRAVFAVHALFATGIFVMSLLSTFILFGVAVPYSHFSKLPSDHNVFNRLLVKRAMNLLSVQSDDDVFVKSSVLKKRTTLQSLRPDHVVGVESIAEPKTQENLQKRKEAVERIKSKEEKLSLIANDFIHSSGYSDVQERARNQNNFTHSNTSAAYVNMFSASSSHPRKKDKGTAKSMDHAETAAVSNAVSAFYSLTKPDNVTANFIFNDVSYSFSRLNWNIGTITFSTFWILENLDQEFGPFQNVHMVYALATFFGLCCLSLCFVAAICNGSCIAISSLQDVELQASSNLLTDWKKMAASWRAYSILFFLLVGGIEFVLGESLTIYALFRPELSLSQRNGLFLTSTFWLGIVTARMPFVLMTKFDNIDCLSNFVLFSAAVAGYVAASAHSFFSILCTVFVLGLSLGPLSPFLFCWLSEQNLSSRLSLSLLYTIGVSLGRFILPCIIAVFIYICSTPGHKAILK